MWRISIIIMSVFLVAACLAEVKPYLKPVEVDIPNRIADQQKWLDQDAKSINPQEAKPIREKLGQVKQKYDRLQSAGALTTKDSEALNRMLDESSAEIFRLDQRHHKGAIINR